MYQNGRCDVSVVCCTYNGASFIQPQLDSILSQTLMPSEIIIQDDGSTDNTLDILYSYAESYPFIHIYNNEGQHGINANFFSALHRASGRFIAISDQDDIWEKDKLEKQLASIGDKLLCGGMSKPFSSDGFPVEWDSRRPNVHLLRLLYLSEINGHTIFFNRKLLDYLPETGFPCNMLYDWQLQVVAAAAESIVMLPEVVVNFRRHRSAATAVTPTGRSVFNLSGLRFVFLPIFRHNTLQKEVRARFKAVDCILSSLPFHTSSLSKGLEMTSIQIHSGSLMRFFSMAHFCLNNREYLFHTEETRPALSVLRAFFYPFSCGWYYRGALNRKKSERSAD